MRNTTRVRGLRPTKFSMTEFDALPPHLRNFINYAPTQLAIKTNFSPETLARLNKEYLNKLAKDTAKTYGPDHPQAWGNMAFAEEDFLD